MLPISTAFRSLLRIVARTDAALLLISHARLNCRLLLLLNVLLLDLEQVGTRCTYHLAMIETAEALDAFWDELLYEMDLRYYLGILQAADDVDYYALQVVWVHKQFLGWNIVALPKEVDLFADLARAAIIDPFEFAHG